MKTNTSASATMGCATIIVILTISAIVGAFCWTYTINSWLHFFGSAKHIAWWQGALIGFCPWLGQASLPAAVITFILMLFLQ